MPSTQSWEMIQLFVEGVICAEWHITVPPRTVGLDAGE